jgi:hypothetical protein
MTISRKSRSSVNVGVDVGKEMLEVCIHEKQICLLGFLSLNLSN